MRKPFQVRSSQRDRKNDKDRILSVYNAIEFALAAAQQEMDALKLRLADAAARASFVVGTDVDEYLSRETKDTNQLAELEGQMKIGERRVEELDHQIADLIALRELSDQRFSKLLK